MKKLEKIKQIKQKADKVNIIAAIICFDCEQVFEECNQQDKCVGCGELYNPEKVNDEVCPHCGSDEYDMLCPECKSDNIDYLDGIINAWDDYEYLMTSPRKLLNKIEKFLDSRITK